MTVRAFSRAAAGLLFAALALNNSGALAACTTPNALAGAMIYNTTVNKMQYCNGTDWVNMGAAGGGGGGGGTTSTMVTNWPDAIKCTFTNPNWGPVILHAQVMPYVADGDYWYSPGWSSSYRIKYNSDGSFDSYQSSLVATSDCGSQSIAQLYSSGQAFNFIGGGGGGTISGSGTTNYVTKFTSASALGNSLIFDDGTNVGIGTTSPQSIFHLASSNMILRLQGTGGSGNAATSYVGFYDSGGTRIGYFGDGSTGNSDIYLGADTNGAAVVVGSYASSCSFYTGWSCVSDARLKTNVRPIRVLDRLDAYQAVTFDWKLSGEHDLGVIAQDLHKSFPEIVVRGSSSSEISRPTDPGAWKVQYEKMGALALQGVKELNEKNSRELGLLRTQVKGLAEANENLRRDLDALRQKFGPK